MKNFVIPDQLAGPNLEQAARFARRRRVLTAIACDSLEGRRLMTGFAGAAAAMAGHGPAEVAGMGGSQAARGDWQRFDAGSDGAGGGPAADRGDSTLAARGEGADSMMTRSSIRPDFMAGDGPMGHDAVRSEFSDRFALDDLRPGDGAMGGDRGGSVPMGGQMGSGDQGQTSTGNTQLDTDLAKLRSDEQAIHDKSQVTPALLAAVRKDLEAIDKAATGTADAAALKTEQADRQAIFASKTTPTDAQQAQLQADHDAVLKSEGVSQTLIDQLAADRLAVKTASNFTPADQATLDADRKAVDADRASTTDSSDPSSTGTNSTNTTAATTTTPATTTAAPALATTSTPTDAPATPPTDPAAPGAPAPVAAMATTAMPTTTAGTDPTMTQTTSTAAPMTGLGTTMHHRGREALGHSLAMHSDEMAGSARSFDAHQGGMGHGAGHSTTFDGRGGRQARI